MLIDKFQKLVDEVSLHEHYQHKDTPIEQVREMAKASFKKLPEEQKDRICTKAWPKFRARYEQRHGTPVPYTDDDFIYFRYLCQTNLFFLCKLLEKYSLVSMGTHILNGEKHNTHEEICNGFFVSKRPDLYTHFEKFAEAYPSNNKDRMLLVPRGGFKSSMDMADCVQYIISWPEVTILILTGKENLAIGFVGEVRGHFTLEDFRD